MLDSPVQERFMVLRLRDKIFPVRSLKSAINASTDWDICLLNSSLFMKVEACSRIMSVVCDIMKANFAKLTACKPTRAPSVSYCI